MRPTRLAHSLRAASRKPGEIAVLVTRLVFGSLALALAANAASATGLRIALRDDSDDPRLAIAYTGRVFFEGPRVRKAFELSIDRTALINVVLNGLYSGLRAGDPAHRHTTMPPYRHRIETSPGRKRCCMRPA
jgi:hypothetical protein